MDLKIKMETDKNKIFTIGLFTVFGIVGLNTIINRIHSIN